MNEKQLTTSSLVQPSEETSGDTTALLSAESKAELLSNLRRRFDKTQIASIEEAVDFAAKAHLGQYRQNGAPYIIHPIAVAQIVSDWKLDIEGVIAALLHDVVEDTIYTIEDIEDRYGKTVALIVNGVSKIEQIEHVSPSMLSKEDRVAGTFRKLLLSLSRDWRVILIKLADRLHNMRTIDNLKRADKRRRIAKETLDIYVPIAERLGFMEVRDELQTLSFKSINPMRFSVLSNAMEHSHKQRRKAIPHIKRKISLMMKKAKLDCALEAREKNIYSVYRKMIDKQLSFTEVDDIIGIRMIMSTRVECYAALGVVHEIFRPVPNKLKDYISNPKLNGYQSLHTTVLAPNGNIMELQIRTKEMHRFAESGMAAHWDYKDLNGDDKQAGRMQAHTNKMLSSLIALNQIGIEPGEFLHNMRIDLYPNEVFVLTPRGEIMQLLKNSTALDMAYAIHTDLGYHASSALINGQKMPISAMLNTGDIVQIQTSNDSKPHPQWLNFVATPKARNQIRLQLKQRHSQELAELGQSLLDRALRRLGYDLTQVDQSIRQFLRNYHTLANEQELFSEIGLNKLSAEVIANELVGPQRRSVSKQDELDISIAGDQRAGITRANCCQPLPPEEIVGVTQKNFGLVIHRRNCSKVASVIQANKHVSLHWDSGSQNSSYQVKLMLECTNRQGLLVSILDQFSSDSINIISINLDGAEQSNPVASIEIVVEVQDATQIERLLSQLNNMKGVAVSRAGAN